MLLPADLRVPQVQRISARHAAARVQELLSRTRHEHLAMYDAMTVDDEAVQRELPAARRRRARGVLLRTMAPIGAATPAVTSDDLTVLDGDHRRVAALPTSLTVLDRRVALLPADRDDPEGGYLEIWSRPLVTGLIALFDHHWSTAPPPPLSTREQEVVALLAEGWTDTAVARRLGISERTVAATVRTLMDRYSARSRFQLALNLSRRP
ncbi:helix-turn-helix transcriptional regulator [Sphaerisporangium fuscum]|uniref:helix-turn-helix transcriptional regulator n=1 Tax=Sphaerisporangium fuscum TaxID=2835868 RepID=UPI001BDC57C7|nr:helix-turn-helix transcriptional regulator [Sphaerisporangium fuscum]